MWIESRSFTVLFALGFWFGSFRFGSIRLSFVRVFDYCIPYLFVFFSHIFCFSLSVVVRYWSVSLRNLLLFPIRASLFFTKLNFTLRCIVLLFQTKWIVEWCGVWLKGFKVRQIWKISDGIELNRWCNRFEIRIRTKFPESAHVSLDGWTPQAWMDKTE